MSGEEEHSTATTAHGCVNMSKKREAFVIGEGERGGIRLVTGQVSFQAQLYIFWRNIAFYD